MKNQNPNPLNKKNQNRSWNPYFSRSKEVTQNGFGWFLSMETPTEFKNNIGSRIFRIFKEE